MTETQAQEYLRNVTRIHVYQALTNLSLWMPVWIVFLATERHLSLTQITVLTGISWTMVALGEVPTGALADAYGRRFSVGLGVVLAAAGIVLFGLLPSYLGLLSALILWSAGLALMSGADMAILYDSMQAAGRVAEYPRMAGRSFAVIQVSQALAGVAGGLLGSLRLDLPLFVTSGLMVLALLVVRRIAEPPVDRAPGTRYAATLRAAARVVVQRRALRYLVLFTALFSGVAWLLTFVLFQPYVVDHSLEVGWVGILFTLLRGAGTCGSLLGHRVARRLPARVALWTLPVVFAACFAMIGAASWWPMGFAAMLAVALLHGAFRPTLSALLNERLTSDVRATVLSLESLIFSLLIGALQPAIGFVADHAGLAGAFVALAILSALLLPIRALWLAAERTEPGPSEVPAS